MKLLKLFNHRRFHPRRSVRSLLYVLPFLILFILLRKTKPVQQLKGSGSESFNSFPIITVKPIPSNSDITETKNFTQFIKRGVEISSFYEYFQKVGQTSTVTCDGERDTLGRSCVVDQICVSRRHGLFQPVQALNDVKQFDRLEANLDNSDLPFWFSLPIMVLESEDGLDNYQKIIYLPKDTLNVIRPYAWDHLTHYLMNNIYPLFASTRESKGEQSVAWLNNGQTQTSFPLRLFSDFNFIVSGSESNDNLVYPPHSEDLLHQMPDDTAVCWGHGQLGQGNICNACLRNPLPDIMKDFFRHLSQRLAIYKSPRTKNRKDKSHSKVLIIQRKETRQLVKPEKLVQIIKRYTQDVQIIGNLSSLSIYEQFNIFRPADIVIGAHGNAIINSLWMAEDPDEMDQKHLIELFPFSFWSPTFANRWQLLQKQLEGQPATGTFVVAKSPPLSCPAGKDLVDVRGRLEITSGKDIEPQEKFVFGCLRKSSNNQEGYEIVANTWRTSDDQVLLVQGSVQYLTKEAFRFSGSASPVPNYHQVQCRDYDCIDLDSTEPQGKNSNIVVEGRFLSEFSNIISQIFKD